MVSKTVKFKSRPPVLTNGEDKTTMSLEDFFNLHDAFIQFKVLEGLAPRTLEDHKYFMKFFKDMWHQPVGLRKISVLKLFYLGGILRT